MARLSDGVVALPADARSLERLEWIADEVVEAGGEATLWRARMTSASAERGWSGWLRGSRQSTGRLPLLLARLGPRAW